MKTKEEIFKGVKLNGIAMLIFNLLLVAVLIYVYVWAGSADIAQSMMITAIIANSLLLIIALILFSGLMLIEPNDARVMVFFGKYKGTVKENGFFWVNPFYVKKKLTLRARNLDAEPIKVNDKAGNPIMIGVVVVWRVTDTYKASFDIDTSMAAATAGASFVNYRMRTYENFVKVQSDAALRNVAGLYAYDNNDVNSEGALTLRSGGEEINDILETQLNERLKISGIEIIEARINYLAYAPEIAAVMLRRQQADAIISAREKIVDGAVGMVKMALQKLSDEEIVTLDEERKAAMVTNLLVVLCSDEPAQPIVNSGTLHH